MRKQDEQHKKLEDIIQLAKQESDFLIFRSTKELKEYTEKLKKERNEK